MSYKSFKQILKENSSYNLLIVDVQPAYSDYITFDMYEFCDFVSTFDNVHAVFNGEELDMDKEYEVIDFYMENGMDDDLVYKIRFFDKGYAFFRDLMDDGVDEDIIVELGKKMINGDINDWRDLEDTLEDLGLDEYERDSMMFYIPDVMSFVKSLPDNCVVVGGGEAECLREIELCFRMLDKPYTLNHDFIY